MESGLIQLLRSVRSDINKFLKPRKLEPVSRIYGFDRGTPIDRYYIENFLENNKDKINGRCLEIHDNFYTKKYGGISVSQSDILDINRNNKRANIWGDLRNLTNITDNKYDCLIITQTLGLIDDYLSAVEECFRILKPGGWILLTSSLISPFNENTFWKFTPKSLDYIFSKVFKNTNISINTYGNVSVCQCFLMGFSLEELKPEELKYNDPQFPLIVTLKVQKPYGK